MSTLKVVGVAPSVGAVIEVDEWVPLMIEFGVAQAAPLIYWRGGDGQKTLVEIGINESDGVLRSLTLVCIDPRDVYMSHGIALDPDLQLAEGVPVLELTGADVNKGDFSDRFVDNFTDRLRLLIDSRRIVLRFSDADEPCRIVSSGGVHFGVSLNGQLSSIEVSDLDDRQLSLLNEGLTSRNVQM